MKTAHLFALALAGAATAAGPAGAQEERHWNGGHHGGGHHGGGWNNGRWQLLGFKTVGAGTDRDTINVSNRNRYRQVQLCAFNAPIHIIDFDVQFGNGRTQDVRLRNRIAPGRCTRAIDLAGNNARNISRIRMTYERIQRGMRVPLVRVMGR